MRALSVFVLGAVAMMVGCSEDVASTPHHATATKPGAATTAPAATDGTATTGTTSPAVAACAGVIAPTSLADAKDATDLRLAGTAIFFQTGTTVQRVLKTGDNKKTVFTSPNLIHSYADTTGLLIVERTSADDPNATLRTFAAIGAQPTPDNANPPEPAFPEFPVQEDGKDLGGATTATDFNSASVHIFASDDANFYVQADAANGDSQILSYAKGNLAQTVLVTSTNVITNPQIASGAIWYVEGNQRIFKVALATDDQPAGTPTEVFGTTYSQCNLAVNETAAFCSVGTAIESRDLTGASPKTLIDNAGSKVASPFGAAQYLQGRLFVRSGAPDAQVKNVIRSLSTTGGADEKLVACGRATVTGMAADATSLVWTEEGAGVFVTTR